MSTALALPEPQSLAQVSELCSAAVAWAEQQDSIPVIRECINRLAAINEYLSRTSRDGRAEVDTAMRRMEQRIGVLIGKATANGKGLEFRKLAEHPDIVDEVIAESTDAAPPSRRTLSTASGHGSGHKPVTTDRYGATSGHRAECRNPLDSAGNAIGATGPTPAEQ
ncbi:MAG: hypothetical protein JST64_00900 [Actinobacteria bacterium]|nr:hypothetical protein [Actinomycetota bacterium]